MEVANFCAVMDTLIDQDCITYLEQLSDARLQNSVMNNMGNNCSRKYSQLRAMMYVVSKVGLKKHTNANLPIPSAILKQQSCTNH